MTRAVVIEFSPRNNKEPRIDKVGKHFISKTFTPAEVVLKASTQLFLILFLTATMAAAQSTASMPTEHGTIKSEIQLKNKKFEDTREITDPKMRADLGSLSRYSFKFDLTYNGPAMGKPFEKDLPNPDNMVRVNATSLKGNISGRYRLDSNSSMFLGGGLNALYPFHGMERLDVNTPQIGYDMFHRLGGAQMRNAFGVSFETVPTYQAVGIAGGLNYVGSLLFDLGTSGFAAGTDMMLFYKVYNRDYQLSDRNVPRYTTVIAPSLKYNFSDRMNVGTHLSFAFWNPRARSNETVLLPQTVTQKLSFGYAFTKTVFVSPYLNFYPGKLAMDTSTVNISTVFSLM